MNTKERMVDQILINLGEVAAERRHRKEQDHYTEVRIFSLRNEGHITRTYMLRLCDGGGLEIWEVPENGGMKIRLAMFNAIFFGGFKRELAEEIYNITNIRSAFIRESDGEVIV